AIEKQKEAGQHLEGKPASDASAMTGMMGPAGIGGPAQDAPGKGENNLRGPPLNADGQLKRYYRYSNNQPATPPAVAQSFDGKQAPGFKPLGFVNDFPPPAGLGAQPVEFGRPGGSPKDDHFRPGDGL